MSWPDPTGEKRDIQATLATCRRAQRVLASACDAMRSVQDSNIWGGPIFFLAGLLQIGQWARARGEMARAQSLLLELDRQLEGLRVRHRVHTATSSASRFRQRSRRSEWFSIRQYEESIGLCEGAIARTRRIANALRARLGEIGRQR